jgi:hypothetical protein
MELAWDRGSIRHNLVEVVALEINWQGIKGISDIT